jgi:hypothetical protein
MDIIDQIVAVDRDASNEPKTPIALKISIEYLSEKEFLNLRNSSRTASSLSQ